MADLERIYVVPLRKAKWTPATKRTKRAVRELKLFIARHMKADEDKVWIDNPVNELLWARGIQKPPSRIRVKAVKFEDDGVVEVSLPDTTVERHHGVALREEPEEAEGLAAPEAEPEAPETAPPAPEAPAAETAPEAPASASTPAAPAAPEAAPADAAATEPAKATLAAEAGAKAPASKKKPAKEPTEG
ncbi:MAG: 50S ribosomal protein L31e [Thermoplasmatota archaeon]